MGSLRSSQEVLTHKPDCAKSNSAAKKLLGWRGVLELIQPIFWTWWSHLYVYGTLLTKSLFAERLIFTLSYDRQIIEFGSGGLE
jgi:hypothetical protein